MSNYGKEKELGHKAYFKQFVFPAVEALVRRRIGEDAIKKSVDPYFNDIPLIKWDMLHNMIKAYCYHAVISTTTGGYSLSHSVCIAKAAARQIKEALEDTTEPCPNCSDVNHMCHPECPWNSPK